MSSVQCPNLFEVDTTNSLTAIAGHICVPYRGSLICWGGYCYDEREIHYRECNCIYIFPYKLCGARDNVWFKIRCETDFQLRPNSGATAGIHRDQLYIFGGCLFDDTHRRMVNTSKLIVIDLCTGSLRSPAYPREKPIPTPRDKATSWMVDNKFFIFGGYGMSWHRLDHTNHIYFAQVQSFLDDDMGSCWNNQLLYYDLMAEEWHEVKQGGKRPSQRAAAASALVPELNLVFLFGGRHDQTRLNDLYVLDLNTFVWTQIVFPTSPSPPPAPPRRPISPQGRSWCTFTLLKNRKKILCYGGLCSRGQPLNDLWHLDIREFYKARRADTSLDKCSVKWKLLDPYDHQLPPRLWHCSVLIDEEAILNYGGMNEPPSRDSPFVNTLIVQQLQTPTLRRLALGQCADKIIDAWLDALMAREKKEEKHILHMPFFYYIQKAPVVVTEADRTLMDLQCFATETGWFDALPRTLHAHLRVLLAIRKRAKTLNRSDEGISDMRSFQYRNITEAEYKAVLRKAERHDLLDKMVNHTVDTRREIGNGNCDPPAPSNRLQLPPESRKRALADEICKYVCENAAATQHPSVSKPRPFLQALFDVLDV